MDLLVPTTLRNICTRHAENYKTSWIAVFPPFNFSFSAGHFFLQLGSAIPVSILLKLPQLSPSNARLQQKQKSFSMRERIQKFMTYKSHAVVQNNHVLSTELFSCNSLTIYVQTSITFHVIKQLFNRKVAPSTTLKFFLRRDNIQKSPSDEVKVCLGRTETKRRTETQQEIARFSLFLYSVSASYIVID